MTDEIVRAAFRLGANQESEAVDLWLNRLREENLGFDLKTVPSSQQDATKSKLSEAELIALDRREYQQNIARHVAQMQSQPVPFSVVEDAKHFTETNLASLRRQLELATTEERPHVEEEIAESLARLERYAAELTLGGDEVNEPDVSRRDDQPPAAHDGSAALTRPDATSANRLPAKTLRNHRLRILKDFRQDLGLQTMDHLARRVAISKTRIYGMVRGDTSRYGEDALEGLLEKIKCNRDQWDTPSSVNLSK